MNLHTADVIIKEHREAVKDYRGFDAVHFSKLSQLAKDPKFVNVEKEDTNYFAFGRYTEDLFMGENMDDEYIISSVAPPTGQMSIYVDALFKNGGDYADAYNVVQIANGDTKVRTSPDKFIENFKEQGKAYYDFLLKSKNKTVIPKDDALLAHKMVVALDNMESIKEFRTNPKYKIYFQVPLLTTVQDTTVKVLVDMLVVDTEENVIYPIDLKTTSGGLKDFRSSAFKYRYDLQGSLYSYVISSVFSNYIIRPFKFLVVSKYTPSNPKFFTATLNDIYCGRFGVTTPTGYRYKGWEELIKEYIKHVEADFWDLPVELWEDNTDLNMFNYGKNG